MAISYLDGDIGDLNPDLIKQDNLEMETGSENPDNDIIIGGDGIDKIETGTGDDIASTGDFDLDGDGEADLSVLNDQLDKVIFEDDEFI